VTNGTVVRTSSFPQGSTRDRAEEDLPDLVGFVMCRPREQEKRAKGSFARPKRDVLGIASSGGVYMTDVKCWGGGNFPVGT